MSGLKDDSDLTTLENIDMYVTCIMSRHPPVLF